MLTFPAVRANLCHNEFGSSQFRGAIALCQKVHGFFYAPHIMVVGVMRSIARTFHESYLPTRYTHRRHCLEAMTGGFTTTIRGFKQ